MTTNPGEDAANPFTIPAKGWIQIFRRVFLVQLAKDNIGLIAAGVAFYGLLALFPVITALVSIAGIMLEPIQVSAQIQQLAGLLPEAAAEIVGSQAAAVAGSQDSSLTLVAILSLGFAFYAASNGIGSLVDGLNVAYGQPETRSFVRLTAHKFLLTLVLLFGMLLGLLFAVVLPGIVALADPGPLAQILITLVRWSLLLMLAAVGIGVLYRFAPDRSHAKWRWLTPGSVFACLLWLAATLGFALYVENFGNYNETFGALAGVVVLMLWLWISAYLLLIGAEINAEAELQTRYDTTVGQDMPMGARGAVKADNLPTRRQP